MKNLLDSSGRYQQRPMKGVHHIVRPGPGGYSESIIFSKIIIMRHHIQWLIEKVTINFLQRFEGAG